MSNPESPETIRILSVSDSESYLKWATQLLTSLPDVDGRVVLIDNPILPTDEQIAGAVTGTDWQHRDIPVIRRTDLARVIADYSPDIVLGAATGPIVAQVFLTAHMLTPRPALVSGLPGMGLPARGKDRKSTRLNSSHVAISYAVFCLKKKRQPHHIFPLKAARSRQIVRARHTDPGCDPTTQTGGPPAEMNCQTTNPTGTNTHLQNQIR